MAGIGCPQDGWIWRLVENAVNACEMLKESEIQAIPNGFLNERIGKDYCLL
jgi:hypothetical protein